MESTKVKKIFESEYRKALKDLETPNPGYHFDKKHQLPEYAAREYQEKGYFSVQGQYFFKNNSNIHCNFHLNMPVALVPHTHDFFEIVYLYKGRIDHSVGEVHSPLLEGDICIINPNTLHYLSEKPDDTIVFNILIKKELLNDTLFLLNNTDNLVFNFFSSCLYRKNKEPQILIHRDTYRGTNCLEYLHNMIAEHFLKDQEYQKCMEFNLQLLCLELTRAFIKQKNFETHKIMKNGDIEQIIAYIVSNFRTADIESISEKFHYHPTYLPQLLKRHTGKTFIEIQQMIRVSVAKERLICSADSIEEISKYVGYSNTSHFYKVFRKVTGISPLEYKKAYKK